MKYEAFNELNHFQYHDAEINQINIQDNNMQWDVSYINATTENSQNNLSKDMCIDQANMQFNDFSIDKIVQSAYKTFDSNKNLIESSEAKEAEPDDYCNILQGSVGNYCRIHSMKILSSVKNKQRACCNIDSFSANYELYFSFSKVVVQWNEYNGLAWYESNHSDG